MYKQQSNKATNKKPNLKPNLNQIPNQILPNKFSGMSYTEQQSHTNWINDNRPIWKEDIEFLKKEVNDLKSDIEEGEFYLNHEDLEIPENEREEIKLHIKKGILKKNMYSREIKFLIYSCNNDWENIKIYFEKLQEKYGEFLEFTAENYNEGSLLYVSDTLKNNYKNNKGVFQSFKIFYEKH